MVAPPALAWAACLPRRYLFANVRSPAREPFSPLSVIHTVSPARVLNFCDCRATLTCLHARFERERLIGALQGVAGRLFCKVAKAIHSLGRGGAMASV